MKPLVFLVLLLTIQLFANCNYKPGTKKPKIITKDIAFTVTEDDVEPPPPNLKTKFKTVADWLSNICKTDKPTKPIQTYAIGLFESPTENDLYLVGTNTYENKDGSSVRIEFKPSETYYRLPSEKYKQLNRQQLLDTLTTQLKDFTKTDKFKLSFLSKATSIKTEFKGQIWKK